MYFKGSQVFFFINQYILLSLEVVLLLANSAYPDEMYYLGLDAR